MTHKEINQNNSKEQERAELHRAIWKIANDLRGSVDGWDFKSYVLGMLFYRFISENLTNYINADEPTANLDTESSSVILELFRELNKEIGQTIIMVTHEPDDKQYVDRVIWLKDGELQD